MEMNYGFNNIEVFEGQANLGNEKTVCNISGSGTLISALLQSEENQSGKLLIMWDNKAIAINVIAGSGYGLPVSLQFNNYCRIILRPEKSTSSTVYAHCIIAR